MIIHTVCPGETIFSIARKYAVSAVKIIENNALPYPDRLVPGQQLLILTPTRTYLVRGGDTALKICHRFGIKKNMLLASNPALHGNQMLHAGTELALRYDAPLYGIATINGYVYEGTSIDRFYTILPYLTYITFCGKIENLQALVKIVKKDNKIPLLRLKYEDVIAKYKKAPESFINDIKQAKAFGFLGITLSACKEHSNDSSDAFLVEAKKQLLGMDMLMFAEVDANASQTEADAADGIILLYEKVYEKDVPDFENGEKKIAKQHVERHEPGKTFLELSSFGYNGEKALSQDQILKIAIKHAAEINNDADKMISFLNYTQYKGENKSSMQIVFESLENIKAKLDLIHEFGFMGAMVDVGRIPISHVMMLYTTFTSIENPHAGIYPF